MKTTRHRRSGGFTMVELMIVVVIIGLAAAMAMPRLQTVYERMKYRTSVRSITSTLRLARSMALTSKSQIGVEFNPNSRAVTIFKDIADPDLCIFTTADSVIRVDTLPPQITWLGTDVTNNVIAFQPNGTAKYLGGGDVFSLGYTPDLVAYHQTNVLASTGRVATTFHFY